jgi:intracellular sulfur oxidation DsrE/DsrF family protein
MGVKAVFHIDDNTRWGLLLRNIQNVTKEVGSENSNLEVVANAGAVEFYTGTPDKRDAELIRDLAGKGVRFIACRNALNGMGIRDDQLIPFVEIVPSGVLELIARQSEGFAYIKP